MADESPIEGGFGLYVHWPFCLSKCPYCDFNSHVRDKVDGAAWREALLADLETQAARIEGRPQLQTIFFGGGTPSLMPPETVAAVIERARKLFPVADDIEITLEANPTSSESACFAGFLDAGVNRLSLGVQSLNDGALRFLGRRHSAAEARAAIELARAIFPRLSFDLIYARPDQSTASWREELTQAIALAADHLSLYQLTIEPQTGFGALAALGKLPTLPDEEAAELYFLTQELMETCGLPAYEISNHAAPGAESRHNLIYWRGGAWIGIGPGAHGRLPSRNNARIATESEKLPEKWLSLVRERGAGLTAEFDVAPADQAKEILLMGLRLAEGVVIQRIERLDSMLLDHGRIAGLVEDGFLLRKQDRVAATATGRPVLNRLIAEILAR